ncbi:MAG: NAD(P)(+) transhydrogenase (Re/Si-specific) subunit beta [Firmicutes bacterium]|nr:NAD(P)(+) transhydrogenase (Re/Si-specific) subunit beta [Bacillota bacterium]
MAAAALFVGGVMLLRAPATARRGNLLAAGGMLIALVFTLLAVTLRHTVWLAAAFVVGAAAGAYVARAVKMTAMPQLVALFNGMGGGAAALISLDEALSALSRHAPLAAATAVPGMLTLIIGSVSFAGSLIAFAKLQELMTGRPIVFPGQNLLNAFLLAVAVAAGVLAVAGAHPVPAGVLVVGLTLLSAVLGVLFVLPVGGADMPVIISLLNSLTGLAAAATGFVLENDVLVVAGALVGASGTILTVLMARAMNRSIANVLFGAFGQLQTGAGQGAEGVVRPTSPDEVAVLLAYARQVVIVPGYGLAVARAQQEVKDLSDALAARGVQVLFGIHPVAGRMPGHMNVLLAEANVPYDRLYELEQVNPEFPRTDVVLVIGANDVVNPAARTDPTSPIYGMPVLNVDQAKTVVVLKRSMAPGFAGIDNPLFVRENTRMLFGDARASVAALLRELREVA